MASLKRYRQTTDSNAAARFRDLPPRFKRQKSIPSPECSAADTHKQNPSNKSKKLSQRDSVVLVGSNSANQSELVKESECSKDKRILKRGTGIRPHLTVDQNYSRKSVQPIVLSPMDNKLFDLTRNDEQDYSITGIVNPFSWRNQQQLSWLHYTPYEQADTAQANTSQYDEPWMSLSNTHETRESLHNDMSQSATLPETNPYPETQPKDYSETDRRIIEMFKELERVADQKEKEEDENGTDRKSLVSHHLRMLMCAIDKYTEGVEDEVESEGRFDEAPTEERSSSPSVAQETTKTSMLCKGNADNQQSAQLSNSQVTTTSDVQTVSFVHAHSHQTTHIPNPCNTMYQQVPCFADSFHQGKPFELPSKFKPSLTSIETQPWDLWSSPSFNGLDVYSNLSKGHNSSETADSAFALFDRLGMENDYSPRVEECLTRTPLYRR